MADPSRGIAEWWEPFMLGVGPAGATAASLGDAELDAVRERCRALLGDAPFTLDAAAWAARGRVSDHAREYGEGAR